MSNIVLVTGAAGFIGSFLCDELLSRQYFVIGVDNLFRGNKANLIQHEKQTNFKFLQCDLSQLKAISQIQAIIKDYQVNIVFHLAAVNGTQHFYDHSAFVLEQNTNMTQNLLLALKDTTVSRIIYTLSSEVYGEPSIIPTPEHHAIQLNAFADRDSYAASKAIGDFFVHLYAKQFKLEYLILRVFNMYGPRMVNTRYGQVIPEFVKKILFENQFIIIGDGHHTRSFCYIEDAAWAMVELMEKNITGHVNLGNDEEISILNLARLIHEIEQKPFAPTFLPERLHDHRRRCPDLTLLRKYLPLLRQSSLRNGLNKVIDFQKKQGFAVDT